ncbi:uncharacterized protein LOC144098552 [Amblyomma americanum]
MILAKELTAAVRARAAGTSQPMPRFHLGSHRTPSSQSASSPRGHAGPVPSEQPVPRFQLDRHQTPSSKSASLPRGHGAPVPSEQPVPHFHLGSHRTPSSPSASSPRGHAAPMEDKTLVTTTTTSVAKAKRYLSSEKRLRRNARSRSQPLAFPHYLQANDAALAPRLLRSKTLPSAPRIVT